MKILVAMSGGVDSSVAAYILREQGHDVAGITMKLGVHNPDGSVDGIGAAAVADAARVCEKLSIPHHVEDLTALFNEKVISYFVQEYAAGKTPNPCVMCNRYLKFGALAEKMRLLGYDHIATGHYARIGRIGNDLCIKRNDDPRKDQTYFLWDIPREILPSVLFPLSELQKTDIRRIAAEADLPVAHKAESQDICFISGDYREFLKGRINPPKPGFFVSRTGSAYGMHNGIPFYTIGQRRGLGISAPAPLYVTGFNISRNEVILGCREDLAGKSLTASQLNFSVDHLPENLSAKVRYAHPASPCRVTVRDDRMTVVFNETVDSITPGQSVVLYHEDCVVGGGVIESSGE